MDFRKILTPLFVAVLALAAHAQVGIKQGLGSGYEVQTADIKAGAVTAAKLSTTLKTGFIPIDVSSGFVLVSNDISSSTTSGLGSHTLPILKRINGATDKVQIVSWVASGVEEVTFGNIPLPPDFDNSSAMTVHLLVYKSANVNTGATIDVQVFSGIGDTEMGSATSAITATTATEYSVSLTGANVGAHPGVINISLVPSAHTSDTVNLLAAWIEYTKQ